MPFKYGFQKVLARTFKNYKGLKMVIIEVWEIMGLGFRSEKFVVCSSSYEEAAKVYCKNMGTSISRIEVGGIILEDNTILLLSRVSKRRVKNCTPLYD
ncbi:MAG: hypothetical protein U9R24_07725 [Thermodesulfobacteriota bacterium]|nr:hypothetical protein [Thermodesulfobacteriota bacterium]